MIRKIYDERTLITRFVTVGFCGFLINYAVLWLCTTSFSLNRVVSELVAALVALQFTFLLNDHWTYTLHNSHAKLTHSLTSRYFTYLATNSFGSLMTVVMFALISPFLHRLPALALAAIAAMVWNYFMNKIVIWRRTLDTKEETS